MLLLPSGGMPPPYNVSEKVGVHHRLPGNFLVIKITPFGNKKVLVPLREQGQKRQFLRYHLVCRKYGRSARCQHTVCPLTLALRQKILWFPISPCPRRPICCPAFRSALSCRNSLWTRLQFYFRFNGFFIKICLLYTICAGLSREKFTRGGQMCVVGEKFPLRESCQESLIPD